MFFDVDEESTNLQWPSLLEAYSLILTVSGLVILLWVVFPGIVWFISQLFLYDYLTAVSSLSKEFVSSMSKANEENYWPIKITGFMGLIIKGGVAFLLIKKAPAIANYILKIQGKKID